MARRTFGPAGKSIAIVDNSNEQSVGKDEPVTAVTDNSRANGDIENSSGIGNREDSGETGNDSEQTGKPEFADPATAVVPKRRGRKPGGKNKPRAGSSQASAEIVTANLEKVLFNLHKMGAGLLNEPDIAIEKEDAALLAEAVKEIATAYDFTAMMNPKTQAWIDLSIACTAVYGERVMKIMRKHGKRDNVVSIKTA